jgi:hypothetical protein
MLFASGILLATGCSVSGDADAAGAPVKVAGTMFGSASVTVVAAGDIARNARQGTGTARLIASLDPDAVLALGDNAYDSGTYRDYLANYDPSWGRFRSITRPVPGNHDYEDHGGAGYYRYFVDQVHGAAYYGWTAGSWRMYALNCEIECGSGSAQLAWLRKDLAQHPGTPALAYVHEPRYTCSTHHAPFTGLDAIWTALQRADGRILLSGHNHAYERFAKQDASGHRAVDGLRQFVVGTGGAGHYALRPTCLNRLAADDQHFGVLRLRLSAHSYTWQFIAVGGSVIDAGRGRA